MMRRIGPLAVLLALTGAAAEAQPRQTPWTERRCALYAQAWSEALARFGTQGLAPVFLERHEAFLASGCQARLGACPRSPQELALADAMTVAAINAGAASTFPPFACRD